MTSAVYVHDDEDNLQAVAHVINSNQLPAPSQVGDINKMATDSIEFIQ